MTSRSFFSGTLYTKFVRLNGKEYMYSDTNRTLDQASEYCAAEGTGGDLAIVHTAEITALLLNNFFIETTP